MRIIIPFQKLYGVKSVFITSLISTIIYQVFFYTHPLNQGWWQYPEFSIVNTLDFIFINLALIECASIYITYRLMAFYARKIGLSEVQVSLKSGLLLMFYFLPLVFVVFFIFNPITQSARFLYNSLPVFSLEEYLTGYGYSFRLYLTYLPLSFFWVYAGLTRGIIEGYVQHKKITVDRLKVFNTQGESFIGKDEIEYAERVNRKIVIHTAKEQYQSKSTLNDLEDLLSVSFTRINRSVIVKIDKIKHYNYWENDKYNLVLKNGKEFTVSRERLKRIKKNLNLS